MLNFNVDFDYLNTYFPNGKGFVKYSVFIGRHRHLYSFQTKRDAKRFVKSYNKFLKSEINVLTYQVSAFLEKYPKILQCIGDYKNISSEVIRIIDAQRFYYSQKLEVYQVIDYVFSCQNQILNIIDLVIPKLKKKRYYQNLLFDLRALAYSIENNHFNFANKFENYKVRPKRKDNIIYLYQEQELFKQFNIQVI